MNDTSVFDYCGDLVRKLDRDRYLASLYVPADLRPFVFAVYAFNCEIASIREQITNPLIGEIRLQYWTDLLDKKGETESRILPPVAQAVLETIRLCHLSVKDFLVLIEARRFDLYDEPMQSFSDLETYCERTVSTLFRLVGQILTSSKQGGLSDVFQSYSRQAGICFGITGILRAFPWSLRKKQFFIPSDILSRYDLDLSDLLNGVKTDKIRAVIQMIAGDTQTCLNTCSSSYGQLSAAEKTALLPLSLLPSYLYSLMEKKYDPYQSRVDLPFWKRHLLLWNGYRKIK